MKNSKIRKVAVMIVVGVLIAIFLFWFDFPLFWMILSSFKSPQEIYTLPPVFVFKPTLDNYSEMVIRRGTLRYFFNSLITAGSSTFIALILGSMAGYALARGKIPRKQDIAFWMITTRMAPIAVVLLPLFLIFLLLRILYTPYALIITYISFNLPFATWLLWSFFESIPKEIEEAAICDGCGKFKVFLRIALPLTTPGIATTGILCFMFAWNDYMFASVFTSQQSVTLPVIASSYMAGHRAIPWGQVTATGSFVFIPVLLGGILIRRYLVAGLTLGAIK
jgi:multiple sugar transport system permease protein